MNVAARVAEHESTLTAAERRVARVLVDDPESVIFGTVASLASLAKTSAPTVIRLANKLGFDSYVEMRATLQQEVSHRLRPAVELIREDRTADPVRRALAVEVENVRATLDRVDVSAFNEAVAAIADRRSRVYVIASEGAVGVGTRLTAELLMLRPDVEQVWGSAVARVRQLAQVDPGDVVISMDVHRYDRWVLESVRLAADAGATVIALTDSLLSPYAGLAAQTFVVSAEGVGPFDSHVGTHALANALLAGVATRLKQSAISRLERIEQCTQRSNALISE